MLYLTLRQYEYVTAIAREGSLSGAAADVNVSQPALSAALSRIETHLGITLFARRKGSSLRLTAEGRAFVAQAQALLNQAAAIEGRSQIRPAPDALVLGCLVDLAPYLLAPALHLMRERFEPVAVSYRIDGFEGLTHGLIAGQVDLAVTYDLGLDSGFHRREIGRARPFAYVAADHVLAGRVSIGLAELADFPLILFREGMSAQHMLALFRAAGVRPYVAHRAASLETLRSLAAHGEGVGLSYSRPPGNVSYDNLPVRAIPVQDDDAGETLVLTRHGTGPVNPLMTQIMMALSDGLSKAWS